MEAAVLPYSPHSLNHLLLQQQGPERLSIGAEHAEPSERGFGTENYYQGEVSASRS